jgi:hypothetical protein
MTKLTVLAALGLLALVPAAAQAEEHMAAPAAEVPAAEVAAPAVEVKEATLKDGTKVVIEGDMVSVVAEDGTKTAAPDGEHELADGTKIKTVAGKVVPAEAAPAAEEHPAH